MTRYLSGVTLDTSKKSVTWPAILLLIVVSFVLTACGTRVANNNWPGMTAGENDIVYVAFGPGVVAVDLEEQEQLWLFRPQDGNASLLFFAPPSVNDGQLVFGDYGASGGLISAKVNVSVYSLKEILSQNPVTDWTTSQITQDKIIAQVLQVGDRVFVGTADNNVLALGAEDGKPIWNDPFVAGHSIWGQSAFENGILYVPSLDKSVYALESETGQPLWQSDVGGSVSDRPILNGDLVYVGSFDKQVHALDKESGESRWTAPAQGSVWGAPAYGDGVVYYVDLNGNAFAVDADSGEPIWENSLNQYVVAATVLHDGVVYVAGGGDPEVSADERQGTLTALSAENGEELWQNTMAAPLFTTPVIVKDSIVVAMQTEQTQLTLEVIDLTDPDRSWTFVPQLEGEE